MRIRATPLLALATLVLAIPSAARVDPAAPVSRSAEVRLPHISIVSIGQGPVVVLIPGLASPRAVWDRIAPELSKSHRVLLVQVNGFGGGPVGENGKPGILDGTVRDIADYLAQEKIERPAVIGHSMGGLVGMMLAKAHPERVGGLMIVDALPFYGALMGPGATSETVRPMAERMRAMLANGPVPTQAPPNMSNSEAGEAKVLEWLRDSNPTVVGQALVEDITKDFTPELPMIDGRAVTVLYAVPTAERAALTRGLYASAYGPLPEARLVPIADSAHFIMLDQPDVFAEEVRRFLAN